VAEPAQRAEGCGVSQLLLLEAIGRFAKRHADLRGATVAIDVLSAELGRTRDSLAKTADELRRRGLIGQAVGRDGGTRRGCYALTDAGRAALAAGRIGDGAPVRSRATAGQERLWRAMRAQRKFDTDSLLAVVEDAAGAVPVTVATRVRVNRYLRLLAAAGVLTRLGRGRADVRYLLAQDLGPLAPVPQPSGGGAWDPNARRLVGEPAPQEAAR